LAAAGEERSLGGVGLAGRMFEIANQSRRCSRKKASVRSRAWRVGWPA
jgi:hypothetical protein